MTIDVEGQKRRAALAALQLVPQGATLGVGTGSTVNLFIEALAGNPGRIIPVTGPRATVITRRRDRSLTL